MVTSDLGQCEWFVWDLRKSGLIERGQLDTVVNEFLKRNPRAEAQALSEYLIQQGSLTPFQADRVLTGKIQGLVLGPYVLMDSAGQGSMGQVYKATSKNDANFYAVKVLPRRSMWNVRLARRQVRSFAGFQHPAVVPFVDVGTSGGQHYLAWPFIEGQTLESILVQEGKLEPVHAATVCAQVAQGLAVGHHNQVFHGLLKPSNIMITPDGVAKILDFGIGSLLVENEGESLVDTMSTANTLTSGLDYASPECILEPSNRTPAGDQYSLGCVLYTAITGRPPFPDGSAVEKMMAHQAKEPPSIKETAPHTPDGLVAIINKLLAKKPEDRFSGCDEVVEALMPFANKSALVGGSSMTSSGHRMPGLNATSSMGRNPTASSTRGINVGGQTPAPAPAPGSAFARGGMETPAPVAQSTSSIKRSSGLPSRASFTLPPEPSIRLSQSPQQVQNQLSNAAMNQPVMPNPNAVPVPQGWIPGNEPEPEKQSFGTLGIVAATLLMTSLVYLAAKFFLMKQG